MANPLTRTVMNNMVKQSPYKKACNQQLQHNVGYTNSNLNEKEEQLLSSLINKKSDKNCLNIPIYHNNSKSHANQNNSNYKVGKRMTTLEALAKEYTKKEKEEEKVVKERKVTSSTRYMDLSSYVPTVSLNSIGKKGFNK